MSDYAAPSDVPGTEFPAPESGEVDWGDMSDYDEVPFDNEEE